MAINDISSETPSINAMCDVGLTSYSRNRASSPFVRTVSKHSNTCCWVTNISMLPGVLPAHTESHIRRGACCDEARNILMDSIKHKWISSKIKAICTVNENLLLAPQHADSHITHKTQNKINGAHCLNFLQVLIEDFNTTSD